VKRVATVVFQLALALWIGALVTVSFLVAPAVFGAVPSEMAGTVMGRVFPLYYGFTVAVGALALMAASWLWRAGIGVRTWRLVVPMLVVMLGATSYAGGIVSPRARAIRPALHHEPVDAAVRAEFDGLHRRAVQLNGLVLLLGLASVVTSALALRWPEDR
jgi:Domain of unknown function (DUF4149)